MNEIANRNTGEITTQSNVDPAILEQVLATGDIEKLSSEQRVVYYLAICERLSLNPLTRPFEYIKLNGKVTLYARRDCADQLRSTRNISIRITSREKMEDVWVVTAQGSTSDGRTDESVGAVVIAGLKGENLANALMKAETKAKRRVTLSICGLGFTDESELDTMKGAYSFDTEGSKQSKPKNDPPQKEREVQTSEPVKTKAEIARENSVNAILNATVEDLVEKKRLWAEMAPESKAKISPETVEAIEDAFAKRSTEDAEFQELLDPPVQTATPVAEELMTVEAFTEIVNATTTIAGHEDNIKYYQEHPDAFKGKRTEIVKVLNVRGKIIRSGEKHD